MAVSSVIICQTSQTPLGDVIHPARSVDRRSGSVYFSCYRIHRAVVSGVNNSSAEVTRSWTSHALIRQSRVKTKQLGNCSLQHVAPLRELTCQ